MGRILSAKKTTLWTSATVFIAVGGLPLAVMLATSLLTRQNYSATLGNLRTWSLFVNSLLLSTLATAIAGVGGITLGILFARTDLPMRNVLASAFSLPLLFPPYVLAVGWFEALSSLGVNSRWLFGLSGAVLVLATAFLPVVLLLTMVYVRSVSPSLEDAARFASGWATVLRTITIPLSMPGILLSLVLVFLLSMGEFGAPSFLRFDAFAVASLAQFAAFYDFGAATAASLPIWLLVFAGLMIEQQAMSGKTFQFRWNSQADRASLKLGTIRLPLVLAIALGAIMMVGTPLVALIWRGLHVRILADAFDRAGPSALRSLAYSMVSASVITLLGFFLAYLIQRRALWCWRCVDALTLLLFTLPGTVIGVGMISLWNRPSTNWLYGTPMILILGFVAQYSALGSRTISAGLDQVSQSIEEAAEVAGAGWLLRTSMILAPILRPSIVTSWTVVFLFCLRDVTLPLILAPPGLDTLSARTMTLMANGSSELIAALCLMSVGLAGVPLALYWVFRRLGKSVS